MARGNPIVPIVHARRGSGRRTEGQYLRPTLSGHLAGHAARAPVPVGSGPESNGPADPLGTNCPGLAVADEVPSAIGGGPPQRAWTAGAHDPGGPTLAASPRRGALQAQQRATRVRVTPWRRLICRTRRTGRARPRRCCRGGRTAAWCGVRRCGAARPRPDAGRRRISIAAVRSSRVTGSRTPASRRRRCPPHRRTQGSDAGELGLHSDAQVPTRAVVAEDRVGHGRPRRSALRPARDGRSPGPR